MSASFSLRNKKIWVAGHRGMVGSAVIRRLGREGCTIMTYDGDLRQQAETHDWLAARRPDIVVLAAARVGGIGANAAYPADFLYDNLMIEANVIHGAYLAGVERLLFLGSSCIYPRSAPQPIAEDALLTGALEQTNEAYAIAKIAGIKLCQACRRQHGCRYIAAMPCNLYGPGDTYDAQKSHVIPALVMKIHAAKLAGAPEVVLWGTGTPLREFLHVDDLAAALIVMLQSYDEALPLNVGSGQEISIATLAHKIAAALDYRGAVRFDPAHPDGTPRKLLDSARMRALGWEPQVPFDEGIAAVCAGYAHGRALADAA